MGLRWGLGVIEALFLLSPLVLVPLALALIEPPGSRGTLLRAARLTQPICAAAALASFLMPRGVGAAALAGAWLALTGLLALVGLARIRERGLANAAEVSIDAGLLYVPVGGVWLVLSRLGATPLRFEEPVVLLTAVHFHYAGFAALVLIGLAGRALGDASPVRRLHRAIVAGAVAATPMLAAGITFSPVLEFLGAGILTTVLAALAILILLEVMPRVPRRLARGLLAVSAVSVLAGMTYALAYALGELTGTELVSLAQVARVHGPLNALGFVLCGLLGFTLARQADRGEGTSLPRRGRDRVGGR